MLSEWNVMEAYCKQEHVSLQVFNTFIFPLFTFAYTVSKYKLQTS